MKILFLCYWGIDDGLTQSTVLPHLEILSGIPGVERVYLYTIERDGVIASRSLPGVAMHIPFASGISYFDKVMDFTSLPTALASHVVREGIDLVICRGTPAGSIGYLVHRRISVDYAVESFEPHADYMVESGVWPRFGLRYLLQRFWESRQVRTAKYLLPVTGSMKEHLCANGADPAHVHVMPCAVNIEKFTYDAAKRKELRKILDVSDDCVVGVYVGKFGGLYYDDESYCVFRQALDRFDNFKLVVLTPDDAARVTSRLIDHGYLREQFHVASVPHGDVPAFLSAADLAFALYKPSRSKKFLSPVKIGEYWAVGLPVLIPAGIGDASSAIEENRAGAVFHLEEVGHALSVIEDLLKEDRATLRQRIREMALSGRTYRIQHQVYGDIVREILTSRQRNRVTIGRREQ